jgi:hypothetical protein
MKTRIQAGLVVAMLAVGAGLSGCGGEAPPAEPPPANPFAGLPFVLVPSADGNLELRLPDGSRLQPSEQPPDEAIKAIRNLSQVVVLKVEGSCYYWVYLAGRWYKMPC